MTEAELLAAVRHLCAVYRLASYHTHDSRRSDAGFPDLVIIGRDGVLWRELKTTAGKLTSEQTTWLYTLKAAGQDAGVWRPVDLDSGRIDAQLRRISRWTHGPT